jgi:hypothetical protein
MRGKEKRVRRMKTVKKKKRMRRPKKVKERERMRRIEMGTRAKINYAIVSG